MLKRSQIRAGITINSNRCPRFSEAPLFLIWTRSLYLPPTALPAFFAARYVTAFTHAGLQLSFRPLWFNEESLENTVHRSRAAKYFVSKANAHAANI